MINFRYPLFVLLFPMYAMAWNSFSVDETPLRVIDTEIEQDYQFSPVLGAWLDSRYIVINVLKTHVDNSSTKSSQVSNRNYKSVVYDTEKEVANSFLEDAIVNCYEPELNLLGVTIISGKDGDKAHHELMTMDTDRGVREVSPEKRVDISPGICKPVGIDKKGDLVTVLNYGHGYITTGKSSDLVGTYKFPSVLTKPDSSTVNIGVVGKEVDSHLLYLPFLKKYQLNLSDPRRYNFQPGQYVCSARDSAEECQKIARRVKEIPFRLMSVDGEVEEVPYPAKLADWLGGWKMFDSAIVTRAGLLVINTGDGYIKEERGMFLVKNNNAKRIWGRNGDFSRSIKLSPDGCKIAFISMGKRLLFKTRHTVKIIDLCSDK